MSESARNTDNVGTAETAASPEDENRIDFGTLFPSRGDPRRPPEWFGRALLYVAIAIIVFMFCWRSWDDISYLVLDIIISLFVALAIDRWLWRWWPMAGNAAWPRWSVWWVWPWW